MSYTTIVVVRMLHMASYGIRIERLDRLNDGQWCVTCEQLVGDPPNDHYVYAKDPEWTEAIAKAYEIFAASLNTGER